MVLRSLVAGGQLNAVGAISSRRLLKDAHRHAEMLERQSSRQAADPGPDDRDRAVKISCGWS
jgi:hypothetical protein